MLWGPESAGQDYKQHPPKAERLRDPAMASHHLLTCCRSGTPIICHMSKHSSLQTIAACQQG